MNERVEAYLATLTPEQLDALQQKYVDYCDTCARRRQAVLTAPAWIESAILSPEPKHSSSSGSEFQKEIERQCEIIRQSMEMMARPQIVVPIMPPSTGPMKPPRDPEQTRAIFDELVIGSGLRKELTLIQQGQHYARLGDITEYTKAADPKAKRLCAVCGDRLCPYSD